MGWALLKQGNKPLERAWNGWKEEKEEGGGGRGLTVLDIWDTVQIFPSRFIVEILHWSTRDQKRIILVEDLTCRSELERSKIRLDESDWYPMISFLFSSNSFFVLGWGGEMTVVVGGIVESSSIECSTRQRGCDSSSTDSPGVDGGPWDGRGFEEWEEGEGWIIRGKLKGNSQRGDNKVTKIVI